MAYANTGDLDGLENVYQKYEDLGFIHNTETMNIVIKSMVNAPILIWDYLKHTKDSLFNISSTGGKDGKEGTGTFIPDSNSYIQLLLACEKYGKIEDALIWYDEIKELNIKITPLIRNIYRQTIENGTIENEKMYDKKSLWIGDNSSNIFNGEKIPVDYNILWSSTYKSLYDRKEKIVDISKVSGIDNDPKKEVTKRVYGSSPSTYRKIISDRKFQNHPLSITNYNNLIESLVKDEKYDEAKDVYKELKELNIQHDIKTAKLLLPAYTNIGDCVGAEVLLEETVAQGIELSKYR